MVDIFSMISMLLQELGEGDNRAATEETINHLKEIIISKKDFVEKEEGKGLVPPDCSICTFEIKEKAV